MSEQVAGLFAALDEFMPNDREHLAGDPLSALSIRTELTLQRTQISTGPGCEVAGAYLGSTSPPTLVVAQALSAGREAFTVLHEFAHFLQATHDGLGERLLAQPDGGHTLEEAACDAFAAEILIPADLAAARFADGVTVDAIRSLWQSTAASRSAICVAASRCLRAPGHITLLDPEGMVVLDAAADEPRLSRGSDQTTHQVVARALHQESRRATGVGRFSYRDRIQGGELYAQVGDLGGYFVAVSVTDHAPWGTFTPTRTNNGPTARWWTCEHCGHDFKVWERPCQRCNEPKCPECGRCGCTSPQTLCTGCYLTLPAIMFATGSKLCVDCA